jgi:hypothetical protein
LVAAFGALINDNLRAKQDTPVLSKVENHAASWILTDQEGFHARSLRSNIKRRWTLPSLRFDQRNGIWQEVDYTNALRAYLFLRFWLSSLEYLVVTSDRA